MPDEKVPTPGNAINDAEVASMIARGEELGENRNTLTAHMRQKGMLIFPTLTEEERRSIKHPNKHDATAVGAFLYKHSKLPLSPFAAAIAAQRILYPSTRKYSTKPEDAKDGWFD
ncbi:MAG: hypothetical protein KBD05_00335 [Candidatus Pacebacteria bacterium]|nr:hypothetical protein [Candidatus Paceibacterota bacterium]